MGAFLIICGIGLVLLVLSLLVGTLIYLTERLMECERRIDLLLQNTQPDCQKEEIDTRFGPWGDDFTND